jgi:hypothetical protein
MNDVRTLPYAKRERLISPDARGFLNETWAILASRLAPHLPEAEAIEYFKEMHAAGLVELVYDDAGTVELRLTDA